MDGLFCEGSYTEDEGIVQDVDCTQVVKLTRGTGTRAYFSMHNGLGRQFARWATPEMVWAGAATAYDQGVDGVAMADHLWTPQGWPWTAQEYDTLRLLPHPELLATADKLYMVRTRQGTGHLHGLAARQDEGSAPGACRRGLHRGFLSHGR